MNIFRLRKMLEAAEKAENDIKEVINKTTSNEDTTILSIEKLSYIENVICDMRNFIELVEID